METGAAENGTFEPPCEIPDAVEQSLTLLDFFYRATGYDITSCKGNTDSNFPSFIFTHISFFVYISHHKKTLHFKAYAFLTFLQRNENLSKSLLRKMDIPFHVSSS